jgi:hypothetical protein
MPSGTTQDKTTKSLFPSFGWFLLDKTDDPVLPGAPSPKGFQEVPGQSWRHQDVPTGRSGR